MSNTITKEQFENLYTDDITKKEFDSITEKIDERFYEVIVNIVGKENLSWVDYDNGDSSAEIDGHFDAIYYREGITFTGEGNGNKGQKLFSEFYETLDGEFPVNWLWEKDYKKQYEKLVNAIRIEKEQEKAKAKESREKRKARLESLQNSIRKKLTKEELSVITFKK